mgnify:CR=1 FL=1
MRSFLTETVPTTKHQRINQRNTMSQAAFEPVLVPSGKPTSNALRYSVGLNNGVLRLTISIPASIYKSVRPQPKAWRLDSRPDRRGRISALIQSDGVGCKKHRHRDDDKSISLNYGYALGLVSLFPETDGKTVELQNVSVTSMGIEFDFPAPAAVAPAKKPKA